MKIIIDRFEEDFAVVELANGRMVNMSKALVPDGAKEGDVLFIDIDKETTGQRRKQVKGLIDRYVEKVVIYGDEFEVVFKLLHTHGGGGAYPVVCRNIIKAGKDFPVPFISPLVEYPPHAAESTPANRI